MLERARFVYGRVIATVEYAGRGQAPPWEGRREKVNLWDVTLAGPGGLRYRVRDWNPAGNKPDLRLLGSMARAAVMSLYDGAFVDPGRFREMYGHLPEGDLDATLAAAERFRPHLRSALDAMMEHIAKMDEGGSPAAAGPKDWLPGTD